jgi:hypothetical protein
MKKIFLVFGIAAFSSASAQQNDVFDIQKHIQKKIVKDMEKTETTLFKVVYGNCWGTPLSQRPRLKNIPSFILPNGDRVTTLPIDNMPCVQPDMRQYQNMPNVVYDKQFYFTQQRPKPGQIPNGAKHYRMIVSK